MPYSRYQDRYWYSYTVCETHFGRRPMWYLNSLPFFIGVAVMSYVFCRCGAKYSSYTPSLFLLLENVESLYWRIKSQLWLPNFVFFLLLNLLVPFSCTYIFQTLSCFSNILFYNDRIYLSAFLIDVWCSRIYLLTCVISRRGIFSVRASSQIL